MICAGLHQPGEGGHLGAGQPREIDLQVDRRVAGLAAAQLGDAGEGAVRGGRPRRRGGVGPGGREERRREGGDEGGDRAHVVSLEGSLYHRAASDGAPSAGPGPTGSCTGGDALGVSDGE